MLNMRFEITDDLLNLRMERYALVGLANVQAGPAHSVNVAKSYVAEITAVLSKCTHKTGYASDFHRSVLQNAKTLYTPAL